MRPAIRRILSASIFVLFAIYSVAQSGVGGGGQSNVSGGGGGGTAPGGGPSSGVFNLLNYGGVDDDSTDNCANGAVANFTAAVNAYSGPGAPVAIIPAGTSNKAFKLATNANTCTFKFTNANGVAVHLWGTIDCAQAAQACVQFGATQTSGTAVAYTNQQQSFYMTGGGYLVGGASLTGSGGNGSGVGAGIYIMPNESGTVIDGINFGGSTGTHGWGANNATLGNCSNYAVYFDFPLPSGSVNNSVVALSSASTTSGACGFGNPNGVTTGSNTVFFTGNSIYGNTGSSTTNCGSVGIIDGGTLGAMQANNIFGVAIPIELLGINHRISKNQLDSAGCTAGGVSATIQYAGSGAVGPMVIDSNSAQLAASGHAVNFMAQKSGSSATITGTSLTTNINNATASQLIMPSGTSCTPFASALSVEQFCNQRDNTGMTAVLSCGATSTGWQVNTIIANCFPATATANIGSTSIIASMSGSPSLLVTCEIVLTVAGSVSSTLPSCVIGYTDVSTSTAQSATITPTWSATGFPNNGCSSISTNSTGVSNTVGNRCSNTVTITPKSATALTYSTTGYASSAAGMTYQIYITVRAM